MALLSVVSNLVFKALPELASFCSSDSSVHYSWWVLSESCEAILPTDPTFLASRARPLGACRRSFNADVKETLAGQLVPCWSITWKEEGALARCLFLSVWLGEWRSLDSRTRSSCHFAQVPLHGTQMYNCTQQPQTVPFTSSVPKPVILLLLLQVVDSCSTFMPWSPSSPYT